jgi:hypothetical protein
MSTAEIQTSVGFVVGYDEHSPVPPEKLPYRFALIMLSERAGEMAFDFDLLLKVAEQAGEIFKADRVDYGSPVCDDAPSLISWQRHGQIIAEAKPELFCNGGGPAPYHDSVTYSVFTTEDWGLVLAAITKAICAERGVKLFHEGYGASSPLEKPGMWGRLVRRLFRAKFTAP